MGVLAATVPTRAGVATPGAAVAASDTIPASLLGARGAYLEILNTGASPDNMTISDADTTDSGGAAASNAPTVANGTNKEFYIHPSQADPNTGNVTITHSFITGVLYKLRPLDR